MPALSPICVEYLCRYFHSPNIARRWGYPGTEDTRVDSEVGRKGLCHNSKYPSHLTHWRNIPPTLRGTLLHKGSQSTSIAHLLYLL